MWVVSRIESFPDADVGESSTKVLQLHFSLSQLMQMWVVRSWDGLLLAGMAALVWAFHIFHSHPTFYSYLVHYKLAYKTLEHFVGANGLDVDACVLGSSNDKCTQMGPGSKWKPEAAQGPQQPQRPSLGRRTGGIRKHHSKSSSKC